MNAINIKVGTLPGRIQEVAVEVGTSVANVLSLAGLNASGYEIRVDGDVKDASFAVTTSTKNVLLVKKIKGNAPVMIKVGTLPGRIQEVAVETGSTVNSVLSMAGLSANGYEIRVDGDVKDGSYAVTSATKNVLLVKKIKGNF